MAVVRSSSGLTVGRLVAEISHRLEGSKPSNTSVIYRYEVPVDSLCLPELFWCLAMVSGKLGRVTLRSGQSSKGPSILVVGLNDIFPPISYLLKNVTVTVVAVAGSSSERRCGPEFTSCHYCWQKETEMPTDGSKQRWRGRRRL